MIADAVELSARTGDPRIAAAVMPFLRYAADEPNIVKTLRNVAGSEDLIRAWNYFLKFVDSLPDPEDPAAVDASNRFGNAVLHVYRSIANKDEARLAKAREAIRQTDTFVDSVIRGAAVDENDVDAVKAMVGALDNYLKAVGSVSRWMKAQGSDQKLDSNISEIRNRYAKLVGMAVDPEAPKFFQALSKSFFEGFGKGLQEAVGGSPVAINGVDTAAISKKLSTSIGDSLNAYFGPESPAFSTYMQKRDPANFQADSDEMAALGQRAAYAAVAAAIDSHAESVAELSKSADLKDYAQRLDERWSDAESSIAKFIGGEFASVLDNLFLTAYPSERGRSRLSRRKPRLSRNEATQAMRLFYDQVRKFFLSNLNPGGNETVEQMFQTFSSVSTPFEMALQWMIRAYAAVAKKPDKSEGDMEFLRLYANSGLREEATKASIAVGQMADRLISTWVQKTQQFVPSEGTEAEGKGWTQFDRSDMISKIVEGLMQLVKQGATDEMIDVEKMYGLMTLQRSLGQVKTAVALPPLPEVPSSLQAWVGYSPANPPPQAAPPKEPPPEQAPEQQAEKPRQMRGGAGMNALGRAVQIFTELRAMAKDVGPEDETIQLTREEG